MTINLHKIGIGHWVLGKDGLPENPRADFKCKICGGHGVVEDSELSMFYSVLVDCVCTKNGKTGTGFLD